MPAKFLYFGLKQALEQYDRVLIISGSDMGMLHGVLHMNQIESALMFIRNDDYYPTITDKVTHLVYSVASGHCFTDGNKRSSIVLGSYFLEINGYENLVPRFIINMENIVLWVAAGLISKEDLRRIINDLITIGEFSEETQLGLVGMLERYEELIKDSGLNSVQQ